MKRLIVNADDLGYSQEVNARIFGLIASGHVTSATLLMNAPAAEPAVRELRHYPRASFGVHLNITEFPPLTRHLGLTALCNKDGEFKGKAFWVASTRQIKEAIYAEWCAQVQRACNLGVSVSHLDSHHHVHTRPELFLLLKRVQRRFGIRKVRLTRNIYDLGSRRIGMLPIKAVWNFALRYYYRTQTTNGFTDFSTFHSRLQIGLSWQGTVELMCHPGNPLFEAETELIETDWLATLTPQARLISYNNL
jgi:chitin disaccharide deacetylase